MTTFKVEGRVIDRKKVEILNRKRIDLIVEDGTGKTHYIQVRPNQFGSIAALPDMQRCTFHLDNEHAKSGDFNFNNLILKKIE